MSKIFANAFKNRTEFLIGINNGATSTKYLSHKNPKRPPRIRATISGTFTTLLAMWCKENVEVVRNDEQCIITKCSSTHVAGRKYYTKWERKKGTLEHFYCEGDIVNDADYGDSPHWSVFSPLFYHLYNTDSEMVEVVNKLLIDFVSTGEEYFSEGKEIFIYNDLMYFSKDIYPNEAQGREFIISGYISDVADKKVEVESEKEPEKTSSKEYVKSVSYDGYKLPWDRELTEEEKARVPKIKLGIEALVPDFVLRTAQIIKGEYDSVEPIKNVLWYGGAGTGKSFGTVILAQLLGLPHYAFDFSKGVDEVTITAGADVKEGTIHYNDSQIVMAARNGGVVEFREFYNARPEVISFLNGFLQEGELRLANGKVVKRHPNCIVVATSNINYAGCQAIDFSTDDRFALQFNVFPMPDEQLLDLIERASGNKDRRLLTKLLNAFKDISEHLDKIGYDEGICSMRKLIAWAKCCKKEYGMGVIEAAEITLLSGISKDKNRRKEIIDEYLIHVFSK